MFVFGRYRSVDALCGLVRNSRALAILLLLSPLSVAQEKADVVWIDVRTSEEYSAGHVSGAVNIPHDVIGSRIGDYSVATATPIYVYCRSGKRAGMALEVLQGMGYTDVTNIGGLDQAQALWAAKQSDPDQNAEHP